MSDNQFYTVKRAAEYLGVAPGTIRRWDYEGKLVAQRHPVNRYRVYHIKDLEVIRREFSQGSTRYVPANVRRLVEFYDGKACEECGRRIDGATLIRHLDHLIPLAKGGPTVGINIRPICHECNLIKAAKIDPAALRRLELSTRRREEIKAYFQSTEAFIIGNEKLREPQVRAYAALQEHFKTQRTEPAIIEIPTGCGKTGVICISPFGISQGRVLVVTPGLTIRDELEKAFSSFDNVRNFYLKTEVFNTGRLPKVVVLKRGEAANQEDCIRADIIIANIHQAVSYIEYFPEDFFDMVIADEGHHTPADSWQRIVEAYPSAKKVYLTATAFRSDGQEIKGTPTYRYRLADAIANGYVKNVIKVDAVPSKLTFVTADGEREYTTDEILVMREEEWFSKGVALSEPCNLTIIDKALDILFDQRKRGVPHQLIAAACSKDHARKLEALFGTRNVRATYVISEGPDGMSLEEREQRLRDFEAGRYDCIIHVGILGEGYDHPPLSVAAIFRPYRSRAPYEQFIGRTLRVIPNAQKEDNRAHVVGHIGLNLDDFWTYFKNEIRDAEETRAFDEFDDFLDNGGGNGGERNESPAAKVLDEVISRFEIDHFLPIDDSRRKVLTDTLPKIEQQLEDLRRAGFKLPDLMSDFQRKLAELNASPESRVVPRTVTRPDLERQQFRKYLNVSEKRVAAYILNNLEISPDFDLRSVLGKGEEKNNYETLIRLVHRRLNEDMGKDGSDSRRNSWGAEEIREALDKLEKLQNPLLKEAREKVGKTRATIRTV